jgi:hypothetical protein
MLASCRQSDTLLEMNRSLAPINSCDMKEGEDTILPKHNDIYKKVITPISYFMEI